MIISDANSCENNNIDSKEKQPEKLCYVYRHIRLDTNMQFYIGKGTNSDGYYTRAYSSDRTNPHWHNIVNKHGHKVEIIIDGLTEKEAFGIEIQLILDYGRIDLGTGTLVNKTNGGEGTRCIVRTPEHIEKLRQANLGRKHTEEAKKKVSEAKKGNKNWDGRKHSEESKKKISESAPKKPVGQYKDGILIKEYPSIKSVEMEGYHHSHVSACCNGKAKSHKGFQWKFL